jgi:hypothetical protein
VAGDSYGLILGKNPAVVWKDSENSRKISVSTVAFPAEMPTGHLPNTNQRCYSLSDILRDTGGYK